MDMRCEWEDELAMDERDVTFERYVLLRIQADDKNGEPPSSTTLYGIDWLDEVIWGGMQDKGGAQANGLAGLLSPHYVLAARDLSCMLGHDVLAVRDSSIRGIQETVVLIGVPSKWL